MGQRRAAKQQRAARQRELQETPRRSSPTSPARVRTIAPQTAFLLLGLTCGLAFVFVTPPFQVPDEPQHFYRAYQISELRLFDLVRLTSGTAAWSGTLLPKSLAALVDSSGVAVTRFRPENKVAPSKFLATIRTPLRPEDREYLPVAFYPPAGYLPQAVGIGIGRLLGLSPLVIFYMGRLFALGAWMGLVFMAIKTTPVLQWTYFLLALMPMTLYLAASNSVDSVILGVSFLMSATLLQWAYDNSKERVSPLDALLLLAMAIVLALSKAIYLVLLSLFLVVPHRKFTSRRSYYGTLAVIGLASVGAYYVWTLVAASPMAQGPAIQLSRFGADPSPFSDVSSARQIAFIRSNPGAFVRTLAHTFSIYWLLFLNSFVGLLGWLDTPLPRWVPLGYVAALIGVSLLGRSPERVGWTAKLLSTGIFAGTAIVSLTFIYVGWNAVGMGYVEGFQGRYLIPVAPVFFLAFQNQKLRTQVTGTRAAVLMLFVVLTTSVAASTLIERFYGKSTLSFRIDQVSTSPAGDAVIVTGWAIDRGAEDAASGVDVELDGLYYPARYGIDRADIAQQLNSPSYRYSGFEAQIQRSRFAPGQHTVGIRILTKDRRSYIISKQSLALESK